MLTSSSALQTITTNIFLIIIWDLLIFLLCIKLDKKFFSPDRRLFQIRKWERDGQFYTNVLHIKKWKDLLPQHIGKNGFSKRNLTKFSKLSTSYIQEFIFETCRAEWNHTMCCLFPLVSFSINTFNYALTFSFVSIITNLPFIFIQRYNRIRLKKLLHRRTKLCNSSSLRTSSNSDKINSPSRDDCPT